MAEPAQPEATTSQADSHLTRADAVASRQRILEAVSGLPDGRRMTMSEVAAAAGVSRSTLYRHFPTRKTLLEALEEVGSSPRGPAPSERSTIGSRVVTLPYLAAGQLGRSDPLALDATRVLEEVPPHLVADQLVSEARRITGASVALYVVDIDGSQLVRLAGSEEFPDQLEAPPAIGPEIVLEGLPEFQARLHRQLPGCVAEPLCLRGRVIGLLLCVGKPVASLEDIATQSAAALELANEYTDFIEATRRRKATTPAAEIQQNLFPPRIARIAGGQLAGGLLPTYEVGGDWFDFVENRDGAWLAIADCSGKGPTAAGLGAAALGALRAARRSQHDLQQAMATMHETVRQLGNPDFHVTAIVGRWRATTATLSWINCGHPPAYLVDNGELLELESTTYPPLGAGVSQSTYEPTERHLLPGQRLILITDGITERRMEDGRRFGVEGIRRALEQIEKPTAAVTAMAIQQAVTNYWREPLEDDGTVVVMAVD